MIKSFKKFVEEKRKQKFLIKSDIERKKINFVFRYLLMCYEKKTENKVDIPAFMYAIEDMKQIKKMNKLNDAFTYAKEALKKYFEDEKKTVDIDLEAKEQRMYEAEWAELQAEMDEAILWGV